MSPTLDDRVRAAMRGLAEAAPPAISYDELVAHEHSRSPRARRPIMIGALALTVAVVVALVAWPRGDAPIVTIDTSVAPTTTSPTSSTSTSVTPTSVGLDLLPGAPGYYVPTVVPDGWSLRGKAIGVGAYDLTIDLFADDPDGGADATYFEVTSAPTGKDPRIDQPGLASTTVRGSDGVVRRDQADDLSVPGRSAPGFTVLWTEAGKVMSVHSSDADLDEVVAFAESLVIDATRSTISTSESAMVPVWHGGWQQSSSVATFFGFQRIVAGGPAGSINLRVNSLSGARELADIWRFGRRLANDAWIYEPPSGESIAALREGALVWVELVGAESDLDAVDAIVGGLGLGARADFDSLPIHAAAPPDELPLVESFTIDDFEVEFRSDVSSTGICLSTLTGRACAPLDGSTETAAVVIDGARYWVGTNEGSQRILGDAPLVSAVSVKLGDRIVFVAPLPPEHNDSMAHLVDPETGLDLVVCCG